MYILLTLLRFNLCPEEARHLRQECYMSQSLRREATTDISSTMRAEHEFHCSNTASVNHKVTTFIFSQQRTDENSSINCQWDLLNVRTWLRVTGTHYSFIIGSIRNTI